MSKAVTVLVVDDEEATRRNFGALLEDMGYRVVMAADGAQGGEAFVRERPAVVLTDLSMPVLNGFGLLELVRRASPETPIIVVSGWGGKRDAIDAIHKGAWDYIVKPVTDAAEEALTNITRHAKASVVEVSLCEREGLTVLEMTDN